MMLEKDISVCAGVVELENTKIIIIIKYTNYRLTSGY